MEEKPGYGTWSLANELLQHEVWIVLFLAIVIIIATGLYSGISYGAMMSLVGFVNFLMKSDDNNKSKKNRSKNFPEPTDGAEKFEDKTNKKGKFMWRIAQSRIVSFIPKNPDSAKVLSTSTEIIEIDPLEKGRSAKYKTSNIESGSERISNLDQILLSLFHVGMVKKM